MLKYNCRIDGRDMAVDLEGLLGALREPRVWIDPTTACCLRSKSPHPFGYAVERFRFMVVGVNEHLVLPFSRPLARAQRLAFKDGLLRKYDQVDVGVVTTVAGGAPLRSHLPLLDPETLIGYGEEIEVSPARLGHEAARLAAYRRNYAAGIHYDYAYRLLCATRLAHIQQLRNRL